MREKIKEYKKEIQDLNNKLRIRGKEEMNERRENKIGKR